MSNNQILSPNQAKISRILVGLIFGLVIAYLLKSSPEEMHDKIGMWRTIAFSILSLGAFILWAGFGAMRRISLLIWGVISFSIIGFIAYHNYIQGEHNDLFAGANFFWILPFLFVTHELVSSGDIANKIIAPFETYFDEAWKRGVQLVLALAFTAIFWGILWLGAALLNIIGLKWFEDIITNEYFAWAASGVSMAVSVHLGDVQPKLINNFRNLVLSVFSWLLPIIVLVLGIFAISLIFTGLKPLWDTKAATASLLTACCGLVLLINAAYQNGDNEINKVLKWSIRIAAFEALIFALIAAFSLGLRINQYGLTNERILALVGVIIATLYGALYSLSNFLGKNNSQFLSGIKAANIGLAFIKSIIFFCILTPIADPNRLSVNSQVSRLNKGSLSIDKFDWEFLRFNSGKYGLDALNGLKNSKNLIIKNKAIEIAKLTNSDRYANNINKTNLVQPYTNNIILAKNSEKLPQSFLLQKFNYSDGSNYPECIKTQNSSQECVAMMIDLNDDGQKEILFIQSWGSFLAYFEKDKWEFIAGSYIENRNSFIESAKKSEISSKKPKWNNAKIGDEIIQFNDAK